MAKDFIYGELLDYRLFVQKDFSELMKKINEINPKILGGNSGLENNINYNKIKNIKTSEMTDIHNSIGNDEDRLNPLVKESIKTGILKLGDVFYTLDVIQEMVLYAENNNTLDQLYPIFIEINNELKKNVNNNYI